MPRWIKAAPVAIAVLLWLTRFFIRDSGAGIANGVVVFLIVWWLVFFTMLPIGVRSQEESGDVVEGSEPGAPEAPNLKQKAWWTTSITSVIWIGYFILVTTVDINDLLPTDGYWG